MTVTAADTVRWLHDDGLLRLAAYAELGDYVAFTVAATDGAIVAYPFDQATTHATTAPQLPDPAFTSKRLVVVGVATGNRVVVANLAQTPALGIQADQAESVMRSWSAQLLLNPDVAITSNSDADLGYGPRYRKVFIPGGAGTVVSVDDGTRIATTIVLNPAGDPDDRLETTLAGVSRLRLGGHGWTLRQTMAIPDTAWAALRAAVTAEPTKEEIR